VLFHYPFSPYARRIVWYLALRGIDYAQCLQPPTLPREDLSALGVAYRRIPVLSIGRDIYCDTRLILQKLEERFPEGALGAQQPDQKGVEKLLEKWNIEGGIFQRAAQLIPADMPIMNDKKFTKDREGFSGRSWNKEEVVKAQPEALAHIRSAFELLETTLLADGRDWILKTDNPSLADIEAVWPYDWLKGMKKAFPPNLISETQYPKVFAWIDRFNKAVATAKSSVPKPATLKGPDMIERVTASSFAEPDGSVDANDPLGLKSGQDVEVWPTDSGFSHHDQGKLLSLTSAEVVIAAQTKTGGKEVRIHTPRTNFRIRAAGRARL